MTGYTIALDDPRREDVQALLATHLEFARSTSPPEDTHALDLDGLLDPSIEFYSLRRGDELLAIGALKRLDAGHAEIKSMHTLSSARGQGMARAILDHLLAVARERGFARVSLETGSMEAFAPARQLYAAAGFEPCEPFAEYVPSRNSTYLTLWL